MYFSASKFSQDYQGGEIRVNPADPANLGAPSKPSTGGFVIPKLSEIGRYFKKKTENLAGVLGSRSHKHRDRGCDPLDLLTDYGLDYSNTGSSNSSGNNIIDSLPVGGGSSGGGDAVNPSTGGWFDFFSGLDCSGFDLSGFSDD